MGYCYEGNKLCCDACPTAGARKVKCPFGYCQALALCPTCRKTRPDLTSKAAHRAQGCEANHQAFLATEARKAALLAAGEVVRCAALTTGPGVVHVLFRTAVGTTVGYTMAPATYDAIPLLTPAIPADYAAVGPLTPAAPDFY